MAGRAGHLGAVLFLLPWAAASPGPAQSQEDTRSPSPASAAVRSLVVPGWGQWAQGQRRSVGYAAAEALLWVLWADRRSKGGELRTAYRDLAWRAARSSAGDREGGPWAYYEALSKWTRSGAFDRDASQPGLQPEEDPATFNGSIWSLASAIHFGGRVPAPGDPSWEAALAWYRTRAWGEGRLWDWTGQGEAQEEYRRLIHASDDRFREATTALGAVLANHLLSAADAFLSARIPGTASLRLLSPRGGGPAWLTLSWAPPS